MPASKCSVVTYMHAGKRNASRTGVAMLRLEAHPSSNVMTVSALQILPALSLFNASSSAMTGMRRFLRISIRRTKVSLRMNTWGITSCSSTMENP